MQLNAIWALCRKSNRNRHELFIQSVDGSRSKCGLSKAQKAFIASGLFSSDSFSFVRFDMLYIECVLRVQEKVSGQTLSKEMRDCSNPTVEV